MGKKTLNLVEESWLLNVGSSAADMSTKQSDRKTLNMVLGPSNFVRSYYKAGILKVEYLIICIICDTDLVNKLILQVYTLHKYK